ncbi:hypothetical protein VNO77_14633 [Canavalia gladiata]|uniref:Uncharacterized protein n=1 Tax=Canavalia gladiata TaxID=3824 RepID=A0AAN9M2Y9_CANGL
MNYWLIPLSAPMQIFGGSSGGLELVGSLWNLEACRLIRWLGGLPGWLMARRLVRRLVARQLVWASRSSRMARRLT